MVCSVVFASEDDRQNSDSEVFARVSKIFQASCLECHNGRDRQGELSLEDVQSFQSGGESGPFIDAQDRSASALIRVITTVDGVAEMPKDKPLFRKKKSRSCESGYWQVLLGQMEYAYNRKFASSENGGR